MSNTKSELMTDDQFGKIKTNYLKIANEVTFQKELSFAVQILNKNSYLNKSSTTSKLLAVYNTALTGLSLNPVLKLAYLVPRYNTAKREIECCLEPSYQGLVKLVTDTGSATAVYAYPVYEGDVFKVLMGTSVDIHHEPKYETTILEKVYAVAVLADGSKQFEVMTVDQINDIRSRSEAYKSYKDPKKNVKTCIWITDSIEMARKTVIRRLVKFLPKTNKWEKLGQAIELDNSDFGMSHGQYSMIESLLISAKISNEESTQLYSELDSMTSSRAIELIKYLQGVQPEFVDGNFSNESLNDELDRKMIDEKS